MATRSVDEYSRVRVVGEGTYGQVWMAKDRSSGQTVALKKISLHNIKKVGQGMPVPALREIALLTKLHDHPHIVQLIEVVTSAKTHTRGAKSSLYLVFEYCDHDLSGLVNYGIKFKSMEIQCFVKQVVDALKWLHEKGVVHRDVKTANLLVTSNHVLKLTDFGLARVLASESNVLNKQMKKLKLTNNVVTLWYRAPELLLGDTRYDYSVDMWSVGCILLELLTGSPVFQGRNESDQLKKILSIVGYSAEQWRKAKELPLYSTIIQYNTSFAKNTIDDFVKKWDISQEENYIVKRLLRLDPKRRPTAKDCLEMDYLKDAKDPLTLPPIDVGGQSLHEYEAKIKLKQQKEEEKQQRARSHSEASTKSKRSDRETNPRKLVVTKSYEGHVAKHTSNQNTIQYNNDKYNTYKNEDNKYSRDTDRGSNERRPSTQYNSTSARSRDDDQRSDSRYTRRRSSEDRNYTQQTNSSSQRYQTSPRRQHSNSNVGTYNNRSQYNTMQQREADRTLFMWGLSSDCTVDHIHKVFEQIGKIQKIRIVGNGSCATVTYVHEEDALRGVREMDGAPVHGRRVGVKLDRRATGGGGGGSSGNNREYKRDRSSDDRDRNKRSRSNDRARRNSPERKKRSRFQDIKPDAKPTVKEIFQNVKTATVEKNTIPKSNDKNRDNASTQSNDGTDKGTQVKKRTSVKELMKRLKQDIINKNGTEKEDGEVTP